jgi:enoyl-[acyl-carrier protein] reductase I
MLPAVKAKLLEGKKGLVVGIANENSIAGDARRRSGRLSGSGRYLRCDKAKNTSNRWRAHESRSSCRSMSTSRGRWAVFEQITKEWGKLDFVVHSIAFSPKEALHGRVVDVSREGFAATMDVSC